MLSKVTLLTAILAISSTATAHLAMLSPPQFRTPWNPKSGGKIDVQNRDPLFPDGRNYPCMNGHNGMTEDSSVATWAAGRTQKMTIEGTTYHDGGSCQLSLSYDKGKTFKVIHSYIGCPKPNNPLTFQIPADAPKGLAIFSWSWLNRTGNREFYHKCAAITITGGGGKSSIAFNKRPNMLVANMKGLDTNCATIEGHDYTFPDPGPNLSGTPNPKNTGLTGDCGVFVASKPSLRTDNTTAQDDGDRVTDLKPGKVNSYPLSSDGTCGPSAGRSCAPGSCCSKWGYCGYFDGHCKDGCQSAYGGCGEATPPDTDGIGSGIFSNDAQFAFSSPFGSLRQIFVGVVPGRVMI